MHCAIRRRTENTRPCSSRGTCACQIDWEWALIAGRNAPITNTVAADAQIQGENP